MKNRLLILLIAFMFAGCGDVMGQEWADGYVCADYGIATERCYEFKGRFTYTGKSITWSGSQSKQAQAQLSWCADPDFTPGAKYDRYTVTRHRVFSTEYEGDKYVLAGTDPRSNDDAFPGVNGVGYFFENPDANRTISAIEIQASNGTAPTSSSNRIKIECPTDIVETGNTVVDNSQKNDIFFNNCLRSITDTYSVNIIDGRVWVVDQEIYLNGQNLYRRTEKNKWIKIDTNGYIVDTVYVNCDEGDRLVCIEEMEIPINSNSMITVANQLGIPTDSIKNLTVMGDIIGLYPPITFPDDFQGYTSNIYAYASGTISSVSDCSFTVPSTNQAGVILSFESDGGLLNGLTFCDESADISIELVSGTSTKFVTVDFCNPPSPYDKGELRVGLRIAANNTSSNRSNKIVIHTSIFDMEIIINQTSSIEPDPLVVSPSSLYFPSSGGTQQITIESPTPWTASLSIGQYSIDKTSGTGNDVITVTASPNPGGLVLLGQITIDNGNDEVIVQLSTEASN